MGPQCATPANLQDHYLLTTKDSELCPLPSVSTFDIKNATTNSVLISWHSPDNNMTGLKGFVVAYHRLDQNDVVKKFKVNPTTRAFRLESLVDDSIYLVCIITQGSSYSDYEYDYDIEYSVEDYRTLRDADNYAYSDQRVLLMEDMRGMTEIGIPSSNDTRYQITRPIVLNLDSTSSRCNKIKTPLDPNKQSMVDNKKLSALIGCSAGLAIFFCIIISIIIAKPKRKEEDFPIPPLDSLSSSYKSPSNKSRSGSYVRSDKRSRTNSQASSLIHKLNGGEGRDLNEGKRKESTVSRSRKISESSGRRRGEGGYPSPGNEAPMRR